MKQTLHQPLKIFAVSLTASLIFLLLVLFSYTLRPPRPWAAPAPSAPAAAPSLGGGGGAPPGAAPALVIYQQYHSLEAHRFLRAANDSLFRGLCQTPGSCRNGTADVDATSLLSINRNAYYQGLACEYSGFFALAAHLDARHRQPWIGFQSWRAENKGFALREPAVAALRAKVEAAGPGDDNVFYFWSCPKGEMTSDFYTGCNKYHFNQCTEVYKLGFFWLYHGERPKEESLPPMPTDGGHWAYMSYFVMPTARFEAYIRFARMFFVALDDIYYNVHHEKNWCPMGNAYQANWGGYVNQHCWCYLLERLVNIWVYHTGMKMMYVEPSTGLMVEDHPVAGREMWSDWFSDAAQAKLQAEFESQEVPPNGRQLYREFGGHVRPPAKGVADAPAAAGPVALG